MLLPSLSQYRKRYRSKGRPPTANPPVVGLSLIAATFDTDDQFALLTFDRAVNIDAIDVTAIEVNGGGVTGYLYQGISATLVGPAIVRVDMTDVELTFVGVITLSATSANGIVAADDASPWAGVLSIALPFP